MPWTEKQLRTAGVALAAKRGEIPVSKLNKAALSMYNSMSEEELVEFIGEGKEKE